MNKASKIYVSGHTGMVGKTIFETLKAQGYTNVIVKDSRDLDLRDQSKVDAFFAQEKPEYVFLAAAKVGGIMANINSPATFLYDNLMISTNIIHAAYKHSVKKLLNLGSSCIYPRESKQPMKEEYMLDGKLEPTNEGYAIAKIAALKQCEYYNKQYNTNFITIIPCNLYGINDHFDPINSHVLSALIRKFHSAKVEKTDFVEMWGTGNVFRELLYVQDAADASIYFMQKYDVEQLKNTFVNVGSGEDISIRDLALLVKDIVGYKGDMHWDTSKPDGMPRKLMDVTRMKKYGFTPKVSLKQGIKNTYDYYLNTLLEK